MKAVDLFAGWGGFTLGAEMAGVEVVWAANHWKLAVDAHALNHPETKHACQDLRQADFTTLPEYDLLLAAPACQGHSSASQGARRPYHDSLRATAWSVIDCMEATRPKAIIVENVPNFLRWPKYRHWRACIADDYTVQEVMLTASHHGVPQRRTRVFIVATRKGANLMFRQDGESEIGPHLQYRAGRWRPIADASEAVGRRIAKGRAKFGDVFLSQHVSRHPGVGVHEPIRTITTADQWILVIGSEYRPLTLRETARAMGFPDDYTWPASASRRDVIRGLGNAVCPPVGRDLIRRVAEAA